MQSSFFDIQGIRLRRALMALCSAVLSGLSGAVAALTLEVVDANGTAVANAVVTLPGPTAVASDAVLDQINKRFSPHLLVVGAGSSVAFPNGDQIRHHVYSFSDAKTFEIKLYRGEPEAPVVFSRPGIVILGCNIHDNMLGYIYVTDRAFSKQSDSTGHINFDSIDALPASLTVWHPALSINAEKQLNIDTASLSADQGLYRITLPVEVSTDDPQTVAADDDDRFRQYIDP